MGLTAEQACARYDKRVNEDAQYWQGGLQDCYDFTQPFRQAVGFNTRSGGGKVAGERRTRLIYDSTAVMAAQRGGGRLKRALTPDFEQWLLLKPGPLVDPGQRTSLGRLLEDTTAIVWTVLNNGAFSAASDGMYSDLMNGMGAMLALKGDEHDPVRFVPLAAELVVIETDSYGRQCGWWYPIKIRGEEIKRRWPDANLHKDLKEKIQKDGDAEIELLLYCWRNGPRSFDWKVLWKEQKHELHSEPLRSSPFITPRFYVVPGEKRGRGPIMLAMPHIKTLNKAVEMQLQAGAFALLGAWMTTDDQLYHPRKSQLRPGGFLKVKRTGGNFGASIERLPVAENFDLGVIIIDELRMQIKEMLFDEPLPPKSGAVRSPTEIVARLKQLSQDINGAFGRLYLELFRPLVERIVDILQQWGLVDERVEIDDYIMTVQILSPLANTQMLEEIEKTVRFYEILVATAGLEEARVFIDSDAWGVWLHERMGATAKVISLPEERAEKRRLNEEMKAAALAAGIQEPQQEESGPVTPLQPSDDGALAA